MNSQLVVRTLGISGILSLAVLGGCGSSTSQPPPSGSNPTPMITTMSPNTTTAGGAAFTLTINGTNFVAGSTVNFGGTAPTTTFLNSTQLTAAIPAAVIASVGSVAVTVTNPTPGGGTSNAMNFTTTSGTNPVPTINDLGPRGAPAGGPAFNLFVSGSNFVASSVVQWNGSDRPTAVVDASTAEAQIPASDIVATGTPAVTVFNPPPGGGSSNPLTFLITAGGAFPHSIAVDPTGKFAYVADFGFADVFVGSVSMYTINSTTGALTPIGPPVAAEHGPSSVAVHPSGKFAYAADSGDQGGGEDVGDVSMYTIDATTGALTSIGTVRGVCPGLCAPQSVVVDPSGRFAYVANEGGFSPTGVSMFSIDATTGALTPTGTIAAAGRAVSVTVDPTGKFAYVADGSNGFPAENNKVSVYSIDATTGALTSIGAAAAGTDPVSIAVDAMSKFAYVANFSSNDVSIYIINATSGALTSMGTVPAGTSPASVAVVGKFAYVANSGSNDVSMYAINVTTGALTSIGTIAAGSTPTSIAIHPSGKFAHVTNSGSNSVSMYTIDAANGTLTLIGTIGT
jgi:6-phosphogluconolactonase (cycloisomerase 2 family)